ncbi:MAG: O-antigen ligase family protein [bacterium]|nr:O-antigen ligase family protein [bacterium]
MEKLKSISFYLFFALLAYMPLHIFLSTWLGSSFGVLPLAKTLKDVVLVIGFLLACGASVQQVWFKDLLKDKLVWLIAAYAGLTLLLALLKPTDQDAEVLGVVYNLRFLLYFLYGLFLARLYPTKNTLTVAVKVVLIVGIPVLLFGVLQYTLLPNDALTHVGYTRSNGVLPAFFIDDKPDLERVMSTVRDPNSFGSYLIIIGSLALAYWLVIKNKDSKKTLVGIGLLTLLCLWFTFSRSAWLGTLLSVSLLLLMHLKIKGKLGANKKVLIILSALLLSGVAALYPLRNTYFVKNVIFHADESTVLEDPNEIRLRRWQASVTAATLQPDGFGPGTAGLASIRNEVQGTVLNENYYLQILHEVGVVGLLLFLSIFIVVLKRLYGMVGTDPAALALLAAGVGLLLTNFLVHIWSNEAVAYTWWGLCGLVLFASNEKATKLAKTVGTRR